MVKSCLPTLIVGWRSDNVDTYRDYFFFMFNGPIFSAWRGGVISWYGVLGSLVVCRWREPIISKDFGP
jgi:hypothetical protein